MKKSIIILTALIYLTGLIYLSLPTPPVPSLPQATLSQEPGDTYQNPDQTAYFTDWQRSQVLTYLQDAFSLNLFNLHLPSYRLNYRPEEADIYIRKHIDSYYLEEIVHPLRQSLFVHGWNPSQAPQNRHLPQSELQKKLIVIEGQPFRAKVILKTYTSPLIIRYLVFTALFPLTFLVFKQLISSAHLFAYQFAKLLRQWI